MNWLIVLSTLIGAWAVLSVLGGERQRQVQNAQANAAAPAIKQ
jgi:hypothetical protein